MKSFLGRPDAIHRATIKLTDIANLLHSDWEKLALELNVSPKEINKIKEEHPDKVTQQATTMFKVWQCSNKATGKFVINLCLLIALAEGHKYLYFVTPVVIFTLLQILKAEKND